MRFTVKKNFGEVGNGSKKIGLKGNCGKPLESAKLLVASGVPDVGVSVDKGKKVTRTVEVYRAYKGREGVSGVVRVVREGVRYSLGKAKRATRKERAARAEARRARLLAEAKDAGAKKPEQRELGQGKMLAGKSDTEKKPKAVHFKETSYYACSGELPTAARAIREHWHIENKLHRSKDMTFREDKNKIKNKSVAANLSQIFNVVINAFKLMKISSLKYGIERYAHDTDFF